MMSGTEPDQASTGGDRSRNAPLAACGQQRLRRKMALARLSLAFERFWPRAWGALAVAGLFVLFSALDLWPHLPARAHLALLWGLGFAFAVTVARALMIKRPTHQEAFERLERASALPHRPLTAVSDHLSDETVSPEALVLWRAHQKSMQSALQNLKAGAPNPPINESDPYALRAALILALCVAIVASFHDLRGKIASAFDVPDIATGGDFRPPTRTKIPSF
jgi:Domain of unknown function (DUF4175)